MRIGRFLKRFLFSDLDAAQREYEASLNKLNLSTKRLAEATNELEERAHLIWHSDEKTRTAIERLSEMKNDNND